jgi:hypothetical protein
MDKGAASSILQLVRAARLLGAASAAPGLS